MLFLSGEISPNLVTLEGDDDDRTLKGVQSATNIYANKYYYLRPRLLATRAEVVVGVVVGL